MSAAGGAESLLFRMRIQPDLRSVDEATALIGRYIETAGIRAGNAIVKAIHYPTLGVGSSALAGGIAGGRLGGFLGGVGGAVGGAAGGVLGLVPGLGGLGAVGGAIGAGLGTAAGYGVSMAGSALGHVGGAGVNLLGGLAGGLRELQGPLGAAGAGFQLLSGSLKAISSIIKAIPVVGSLLGPLSNALAAVPNILKDITGSLISFAEKANPAVVEQWQMALDDTQAVIGHAFIPVLDLMREGVRLFADTLAKLLPNENEVSRALGVLRGVFRGIADEVRAALDLVGPAIRQNLLDGLRWLAHWAAVAARAIWMLVAPLMGISGTGGGAGGITAKGARLTGPGGAGDERTSYNQAWRPAQITSIEAYQQRLQEAFFSMGAGGQGEEDPAKASAGYLKDLKKIEEDALAVSKWIEGQWKQLQNLYDDTKAKLEAFFGDARTFFSNVASFIAWARKETQGRTDAGNALVSGVRTSAAIDAQAAGMQAQGRIPHWRGAGGTRQVSGLSRGEDFAQSVWQRLFGR